MKKIDWYIIRKFLGTYFFAAILLTAIIVVIDFSERIDEFIEKEAPLRLIVGQYYLNFVPHMLLILSPILIFVSVIFFTSQMSNRSELVAILASGVSFYRILFVPYFIAAAVLVAMQLYANHDLVPAANKDRLAFEYKYIRSSHVNPNYNVHMQINPTNFIYMKQYNPKDSSGINFTLETVEGRELKRKLSASKIKWSAKDSTWHLTNFVSRAIDGKREKIREGAKMDTTLDLHPNDFEQKIRFKEAMDRTELLGFIDKMLLKGSPNLEFYQVEHHRRTATPFATFVLTIIGFSIASRKVRGGLGIHLFMGIAMSATYMMFLQFAMTFATKGNLSPLLSVWIPNFIFGFVSLVLLYRAPK